MYTPFKMKGKSPMMKKLIGNQHRLPEHLKAKIEAAPESPGKLKKSATKLKKESVAKLKKSATKMKKSMAKNKINPFSAEYKRMTVSQRKKKYGDDYKSRLKGSGKEAITKENIGKAIEKTKGKINKLNEKVQKGADKLSKDLKKTKQIKIADKLKLPKKGEGTSSKTTSNKGGFTSRKGDPYLYRKNNDGTFTTKKGEDGKEITVKKGSKAYDAISSVFKLKKSSSAKMKKAAMKMKKESMAKMKKSAMKLKKSAAKLKKKTKYDALDPKQRKNKIKERVGTRTKGRPVKTDLREGLRVAVEAATEGGARATMRKFRKTKKMDSLGLKKLKVNTKPRPQSSGKLKK